MKRVCLLTGARRGLGSAFKKELEGRGYQVIAPHREELELASEDSLRRFLSRLDQPIDLLVNNAGINVINPIQRSGWRIGTP